MLSMSPWRAVLALLLPAAAHADGFLPAPLTPAQATADVALMRRAPETIHPGLYRYDSKARVDAAFGRLEQGAAQGTDQVRLWRDIALMLASIHCDHTKPEPPAALERFRLDHPTHLPLRFRIVEGRMNVVSADKQPGAPPAGSGILAINSQPVPRVLATLAQAVAYDGDTTQAIAAKLASDSDLAGDDLNQYWPAFFGFPARWELDWKPAGGAHAQHAGLAPIDQQDWARLPWPGAPYHAEFYRALDWRLNGKTAYLRLDTMVNYRNAVEPTTFLGGFFQSLRAARSEHMILDLREAGGGSEDVAIALGRYLMRANFIWSKPSLLKAIRSGDLPRYIDSWGDRDLIFSPPEHLFQRTKDGWWQRLPEPDPYDGTRRQHVLPDRFDGRLTVLTGPLNASGATRTIAHLKEAGATLIGEASAGSAEGPTAGRIFLLTLPNSGIRVRIPQAWNRTALRSFTPRRGVAVDVQVTPTYLDLLAGKDAALAVARALPTPAAAPRPLAAALRGHWSGSLEYRDYGNDRRVILPVQLDIEGDMDTVQASFVIDDGPGKTVRNRHRWLLDAARGSLQLDEETATLAEYRRASEKDADQDVVLVAEGSGQENGEPVRVRHIWQRRGDQLSLTSLSQRPGQPWLLRHSSWLRAG